MTWLVSAFLALGLFISILNWLSIYWSIREKKNYSPVPFFGAWFVGMGLAGFQSTRSFWWLCFLIDYGTFALILALPTILHEVWSTCWINRLHQFHSSENGRDTTITLFRRGHAIIKMKFDSTYRDKVRGGSVSLSKPCKWHVSDLDYHLDGFSNDRVLRIRHLDHHFVCEDSPVSTPDIWYDKLSGVQMVKQ